MSASCPYEIEENLWDEFEENDDHIVPHPSKGYGNQFSGWNDTCKDLESANECGFHGKQKLNVQSFSPWSKEVKTTASYSTRMSNHRLESGRTDAGDSKFCTGDSIIVERSDAVDSDSQNDNDLNFFDNDQEDNENNELLYHGWQDIGNFDDVDRMFRSCDSTLGLGNLSNEEEYYWFSTSHATDEYEDASTSSFKFTNSEGSALEALAQNNEDFKLMNAGLPIGSFDKKSHFVEEKMGQQRMDDKEHGFLGHIEAANGLKSKFDLGDGTMKKEQVLSLSLSQVKTVENPHGPSSDDPGRRLSENRETMFSHNVQAAVAGNFEQTSSVAFKKQVSSVNPVLPSQYEMQDCGEAEGIEMGIPREIESLNLKNSCMSSLLNEISLEATSFLQLQQIIEQLDMGTKLCIRDGLYRLARVAERMHSYTDPKAKIGENKEASGVPMVQETKRCSGFPDMETDTNPLDRSIAHLLFHRPSETSVMSTNDSLSMKAPPLVHGSATSSHVIADKVVFQEGTCIDVDNKTLLIGDK